MAKGMEGQTCAEAIRSCFIKFGEPLSYSRIFQEVKQQGTWKDTTIWRHLMSTVVNLIPARYEWGGERNFCFSVKTVNMSYIILRGIQNQ